MQEPFFYITQMESYNLPLTFKAPTSMVLTRSTEGLSAPLARFFPEYSPLPNESYRTLPRGVVATSHTPLGGDFLLTDTVLSPTSIFRGAFVLECRPNPRYSI